MSTGRIKVIAAISNGKKCYKTRQRQFRLEELGRHVKRWRLAICESQKCNRIGLIWKGVEWRGRGRLAVEGWSKEKTKVWSRSAKWSAAQDEKLNDKSMWSWETLSNYPSNPSSPLLSYSTADRANSHWEAQAEGWKWGNMSTKNLTGEREDT